MYCTTYSTHPTVDARLSYGKRYSAYGSPFRIRRGAQCSFCEGRPPVLPREGETLRWERKSEKNAPIGWAEVRVTHYQKRADERGGAAHCYLPLISKLLSFDVTSSGLPAECPLNLATLRSGNRTSSLWCFWHTNLHFKGIQYVYSLMYCAVKWFYKAWRQKQIMKRIIGILH